MKKLVLLIILISGVQFWASSQIIPIDLTCEYMVNPTVVDVAQPRLGWINQADANVRGQVQTAWQVRVASSADRLDAPDLWDSGKKKSIESTRIRYEGKP